MNKLTKRIITLLAVLVMVLPLATFGNRAASSVQAATTSKSTHVITDQAGNKVAVPKKVKRVAVVGSVWPLPSVIAVFFNSADKIVSMPKPSMVAAKSSLLSELYPGILKSKTSSNDGVSINTEELKKSKPDVVFYGADDPKLGKQLQSAGFAAVAVSVSKWHFDTIATQNHWIDLLSKIFPKNNKAKVVKDYSNQVYQRVQKKVKNIKPADQQTVFFLRQYSSSAITTGGVDSFGQYWAKAIGAKNVVNTPNSNNSTIVNMEQIYKWNPDKILITNFNTAQPKDLYNNTVGNFDWSKVKAVKDKQVYKMPLGMYRSYTPGIDTPLTLLWMAKTVYPKQFKDVNIIKETKTYYKKVFKINLTDKQANKIFNPGKSSWKN
ncbi:ABC transporter substrate-binding protein [Loigolactobacillus binensis]|uniref:ABC transporter substrate-binding protein n=1 Tax=Loigolactobacillus binensis TaxID=2559922 RepID=A0ABW3EAK0_9LACO|nr:ABC transporter substrate-binding protein [Loigolactobacillus binensis]